MAVTQKINSLSLVSYSLLQTVLARTYRLPQYKTSQTNRQTTDRRRSVPRPRVRPIVRSAKKHGLGQYGAEPDYSTLPFGNFVDWRGKQLQLVAGGLPAVLWCRSDSRWVRLSPVQPRHSLSSSQSRNLCICSSSNHASPAHRRNIDHQLSPQFNQSWQLSNSQDGSRTNSRRYDDLLFIDGVIIFWMISFL